MHYILVTMRISASTNAWRKVEGVMGDRRIYHVNIKEMYSARVLIMPAYVHDCTILHGTITEKPLQEKVQSCANNLVSPYNNRGS